MNCVGRFLTRFVAAFKFNRRRSRRLPGPVAGRRVRARSGHCHGDRIRLRRGEASAAAAGEPEPEPDTVTARPSPSRCSVPGPPGLPAGQEWAHFTVTVRPRTGRESSLRPGGHRSSSTTVTASHCARNGSLRLRLSHSESESLPVSPGPRTVTIIGHNHESDDHDRDPES
jgi:hypothetical protein